MKKFDYLVVGSGLYGAIFAHEAKAHSEYKKLAEAEDKVIFGGRLGEYKYYDMDQVIAAVLDKCEKELGE